MTNDERKILEAELDKLSPTAQAILKKILTPAEIEIIDEKHQRFNGKIYTQNKDGHYRHDSLLHRDVWTYFNGEIPRGYVIHHRNVNKSDNRIENLQMLTNSEHRKLHNELASNQPFKICPICGKAFRVSSAAAFWGKKYCSIECVNKAYTEKYTCIYCGKEFFSDKFNDRKFCSISCASKHAWERDKRIGKNRNGNRQRDAKGRFVSEKK